jgi:hypothetical protein
MADFDLRSGEKLVFRKLIFAWGIVLFASVIILLIGFAG